MSADTKKDTAPLTMISAYGFLALPLAFAGLPLYIHIPDFYTREMGLGLASAGFILMALRFLDAVQDPLIGYISDKSAALQRIVMAVGIIALLIGMCALMFGPPDFIPVAHWFAGSVAITALGLSMSSINLVMIGSLWSRDSTQRNRISASREGLSLIGMLLASILPGILVLSMSKAASFQVFYYIFSGLLLLSAIAFIWFYRRLPSDHEIFKQKAHGPSIRLPLRFFLQNRGFLSACFLTHIAASFPAVLFLYFVTDYLEAGKHAGLFLFLYFLSGVCFMPLWLKISKLYSLERAWFISMVVAASIFIWAFGLKPGDFYQFIIICALSGAALGADLALPPAMMAKRLHLQYGENYATQAYAVLNLIPKIAVAMATGCAFLLLDHAGFIPSQGNDPDSLWMLAALYALVPCIIKIISGIIVFNLDREVENHDQKRNDADGHFNRT